MQGVEKKKRARSGSRSVHPNLCRSPRSTKTGNCRLTSRRDRWARRPSKRTRHSTVQVSINPNQAGRPHSNSRRSTRIPYLMQQVEQQRSKGSNEPFSFCIAQALPHQNEQDIGELRERRGREANLQSYEESQAASAAHLHQRTTTPEVL